MRRRAFIAALGSVVIAASAIQSIISAIAQTYPSRPITIMVPYAAGGSTDVIARLVAQRIREIGRAHV